MSTAIDLWVDVDLSLEADDAGTCLRCDNEAVMEGVTSVPCGCHHLLCMAHYEAAKPLWTPGDRIWCHFCAATLSNFGHFLRWAKA